MPASLEYTGGASRTDSLDPCDLHKIVWSLWQERRRLVRRNFLLDKVTKTNNLPMSVLVPALQQHSISLARAPGQWTADLKTRSLQYELKFLQNYFSFSSLVLLWPRPATENLIFQERRIPKSDLQIHFHADGKRRKSILCITGLIQTLHEFFFLLDPLLFVVPVVRLEHDLSVCLFSVKSWTWSKLCYCSFRPLNYPTDSYFMHRLSILSMLEMFLFFVTMHFFSAIYTVLVLCFFLLLSSHFPCFISFLVFFISYIFFVVFHPSFHPP